MLSLYEHDIYNMYIHYIHITLILNLNELGKHSPDALIHIQVLQILTSLLLVFVFWIRIDPIKLINRKQFFNINDILT